MSKVAIVYWSGTGNTEAMATFVEEGAKGAGAEVTMFTASDFSADQMKEFDKAAFAARPWARNSWKNPSLSRCLVL